MPSDSQARAGEFGGYTYNTPMLRQQHHAYHKYPDEDTTKL